MPDTTSTLETGPKTKAIMIGPEQIGTSVNDLLAQISAQFSGCEQNDLNAVFIDFADKHIDPNTNKPMTVPSELDLELSAKGIEELRKLHDLGIQLFYSNVVSRTPNSLIAAALFKALRPYEIYPTYVRNKKTGQFDRGMKFEG